MIFFPVGLFMAFVAPIALTFFVQELEGLNDLGHDRNDHLDRGYGGTDRWMPIGMPAENKEEGFMAGTDRTGHSAVFSLTSFRTLSGSL